MLSAVTEYLLKQYYFHLQYFVTSKSNIVLASTLLLLIWILLLPLLFSQNKCITSKLKGYQNAQHHCFMHLWLWWTEYTVARPLIDGNYAAQSGWFVWLLQFTVEQTTIHSRHPQWVISMTAQCPWLYKQDLQCQGKMTRATVDRMPTGRIWLLQQLLISSTERCKVWLTPTTRVSCTNAPKTQNALQFTGVLQTPEPISAISRPQVHHIIRTCRGGIAV